VAPLPLQIVVPLKVTPDLTDGEDGAVTTIVFELEDEPPPGPQPPPLCDEKVGVKTAITTLLLLLSE